ncbi:3'-N-debenzoyl-2'-deoxytaxol N-benzoyltransferase-like isoform X1 [Canna indica]|uniref:3'-N-debenzoyl-2'-deoxytaxol N-benzoyltransferase-like isoform X1 n=1 Tax=Canna indica TaxID=4628 RepID=A0AAQ3JW22_9LILI|nr:3'-N-debenzoyl-2'-deoxytaxol N-benzoyltransferase-like isoform X1 [Canna indica]
MSFSYSAKKPAPELVVPAGPTPGGRLPLSSMDRTAVVRILVDLVLVFKQGLAPATAIKAALSRALVPYYPVAGRIVEPSPGKTEVACTGDGVWFVEASAECSLKDANNLERPLLLPKQELLPFAPSHVNEQDLIFMMQVTNFTCGGFAVGIRFSHTVFDGLGAAQFLKAVAELARGHARLVVDPVWRRDAIPTPPKVSRGHPPTLAAFHFETAVFDVSADRINLVKNLFSRETGQKCSTFDVVTAIVWQCRTRAIGLPPAADVHLGFAANTRHLLRQLLPQEGFYGNCVYPMAIKARGERIDGASLVEVIEVIREAKERMSGMFLSWVMGGSGEDPYKVPLDYGTMVVSDWSRVGFAEVNYGWGEAIHVAPVNDECNFVASCIYLQPSKPKQGMRLMTRCVEKQHLPAFTAEMTKFLLHK